ncbi:hypothetical protein EYF80_030539 [Liparis tanakae]|uniref:Uncharacterized protein n=1 Tax=Liparis tanakae TaxID=230148 RepID=A0A4Z2H356_9TELE|nr:hypothetical protein EYF80_030539 [Liparis tanakae]
MENPIGPLITQLGGDPTGDLPGDPTDDLTSDGWLEHCEVRLKRMSSLTSTATALRTKEKKRLRSSKEKVHSAEGRSGPGGDEDSERTLFWLVSEPQALVMFGKTSDHPAGVQFLLMLPARETKREGSD